MISRIENGETVEDWAASDNLELIRQLGPQRLLLLGLAWLRARARLIAHAGSCDLRVLALTRGGRARHVEQYP